jgi:peptidoglycan hydrolase-like protein with peptidoglycan-binding domain
MATELQDIAAGRRVVKQGNNLCEPLKAKLSLPGKETLDEEAVSKVRELQRSRNLTFKDGKIGPETISELAPEVATLGYKTMILRREKVLKEGMGKTESEKTALRGVGKILNEWIAKDNNSANGLQPVGDKFDENYKNVVKAFQRSANLKDDGIVGERTLKALLARTEDGEIPYVKEKVAQPQPKSSEKAPPKEGSKRGFFSVIFEFFKTSSLFRDSGPK